MYYGSKNDGGLALLEESVAPSFLGVTETATPPDPALAALVKKYLIALYVLQGQSVANAKKAANNANPNSYSSLFSTASSITDAVNNVNLIASPSAADFSNIAVALATNHQLPGAVKSLPSSVLKNLQQEFGKKIVESEGVVRSKNPFSSASQVGSISTAQWKEMIAAAESAPAQSASQKEIEQNTLSNLYQAWLKDFGLQDTAKNKTVWNVLLKAGKISSGGIAKELPAPFPMSQNPYDTAMQASSGQQTAPGQPVAANACAGAMIAGHCITSQQDLANYVALLNQGLLSNTATVSSNPDTVPQEEEPTPTPQPAGGPQWSTPPQTSNPCATQTCDQNPACCDINVPSGTNGMDGMGMNDFLPSGLSPYPSPQAYQLLSTPVGQALYAATQDVLTNRYNMVPVANESQDNLINRTALLFVQQFGDKWQGDITPDAVDADSDLQTIVAFVSPLSDRRSSFSQAIHPAGWSTQKKFLVGAGILVGTLLLFYFYEKRKGKTSSAPVPVKGIS